ncbi:MAG: hypothetical protein U9N32_00515 [Spirochaetota bacterium]|nr:hypothetical protein [Spirochaetota bacterium]
MYRLKILYLLLGLYFSVFNVSAKAAENGIIDLDLWTEVTDIIPALDKNEDPYLKESEIYRRTLEDAVWVISGMIYGFTVSYTPLDISREVDEYLDVTPLASIPWGDKKLEVVDTWFKNEKLFMQIRYFLNEAQITRLKLWESNIFPDAEGIGVVSVFSGYQGRVESIKEGIKEALRNYLRIRNTNKPREIICKALLNKSPYTILDAGGYRSKVNITIKFTEIAPYSYY